jgi:hypothetical protein
MRLTIQQALEYMKDNGHPMSRATYMRHKSKVQSRKLQRLYNIAKTGFTDEHLASIDQLELVERLMWKEYNDCKDPFKRSCILEKICNIRPYLSAYYETSKDIIESNQDDKRIKRLDNNSNITSDNNNTARQREQDNTL